MPSIHPAPLTPEDREHQRIQRVKGYIAALSPRDWSRIQALAETMGNAMGTAALDDLDGPIRVACVEIGHESRWNGERFGTLRCADGTEVALLAWVKG